MKRNQSASKANLRQTERNWTGKEVEKQREAALVLGTVESAESVSERGEIGPLRDMTFIPAAKRTVRSC